MLKEVFQIAIPGLTANVESWEQFFEWVTQFLHYVDEWADVFPKCILHAFASIILFMCLIDGDCREDRVGLLNRKIASIASIKF